MDVSRKVTFVAIAAAFLASISLAQSKVPSSPLAAGTSDTFVLTIGAWDMQPENSANAFGITTIDTGSYLRTSSTGGTLTSNIHLPAGVLLDHVELDACDEDASKDIVAKVSQCDDDFGGPGGCTVLDNFGSSGTPGCFFKTGATLSYTMDYNSANDYIVEAVLPNSATVGFRGLKIYYHLQVSPAPASATFNDVPVSDPGFQYVQALYASGITAGCGGGNYCPDSPLTRRQMAIFLAKAFGLRWPY